MTPRLRRALEDVQAAYGRTVAARGAAVLVGSAGAGVVLLVGLDNLLGLPSWLRCTLGGALLLWLTLAFWKFLIRPLLTERPPEFWALLLERKFPDLDCRLINTLLLEASPRGPLADQVARLTAREADKLLKKVTVEPLLEKRPVLRASMFAAGALCAFVLYALLLPSWFSNGFHRYLAPFGSVNHLGAPKFVVKPGDVKVKPGEIVTVELLFETPEVPAQAFVRRGDSRYAMSFDGRGFRFSFPPAGSKSFKYRVEAGGARSPWYTVTVVQPPSVVALTLIYRYPDYTGVPVRFEENAAGPISAPKGTVVEIRARADRPLKSARVRFCGEDLPLSVQKKVWAVGRVTLEENGSWSLAVVSAKEGLEGGRREYPVRIVPDRPPEVTFVAPKRGRRFSPGRGVAVLLHGRDDFGLKELFLQAALSPEGPWRRLGGVGGRKARTFLQYHVKVRPRGEKLYLQGGATDFAGNSSFTEPLLLSALSPEEFKQRELSAAGSALLSLTRILELQTGLKGKTEVVVENPARSAVLECRAEEKRIVGFSLDLLSSWDRTGLSAAQRVRFNAIVRGPMDEAVRLFDRAAISKQPVPVLRRCLDVQAEIIRKLRELIGDLEDLASELRAQEEAGERGLLQKAPRKRDALGRIADKLKEFVSEQKQIVEASEKLLDVRVDDFSADGEAEIAKLAEAEERWAGIVAGLASDFAKLAPQDMADATLVDELLEVFSEVDAASRALKQKAVEIAVPLEQSGLELAEELTVNIERWLADEPDRIRWSMEDPPVAVEVPLVDLPRELEDIVGDLIDDEEAMTEDVEDVTSGWIDSLNEGAGWTAMDGPISNMSARGVTGNLLPNQSEVGGRSGEGRSGRSHGQMVEKEATGKGGRPTPTRVTPDPFEAGQVLDRGKDRTGGATGGGKLAGTAPGGLLGPASPDLGEKLRRLGRAQAQALTKAQRARRRLRALGIPTESLEGVIELMQRFERAVKSGRPADLAGLRERIVRRLESLRAEAGERVGRMLEGENPVLERVRDRMADAASEPVPESYRQFVKSYYEALSGYLKKTGAESK